MSIAGVCPISRPKNESVHQANWGTWKSQERAKSEDGLESTWRDLLYLVESTLFLCVVQSAVCTCILPFMILKPVSIMFKNSPKTSRVLEAQSVSCWHSIKWGGLNFNFFFFCLPNFELLLALSLSASLSHPSLPHLHLFSFLPSTLAIALWVPTRSYHRDQRCHGNCGLQQWQRQRRQQQNFSLSHSVTRTHAHPHARTHTHTHKLMDDTD